MINLDFKSKTSSQTVLTGEIILCDIQLLQTFPVVNHLLFTDVIITRKLKVLTNMRAFVGKLLLGATGGAGIYTAVRCV